MLLIVHVIFIHTISYIHVDVVSEHDDQKYAYINVSLSIQDAQTCFEMVRTRLMILHSCGKILCPPFFVHPPK